MKDYEEFYDVDKLNSLENMMMKVIKTELKEKIKNLEEENTDLQNKTNDLLLENISLKNNLNELNENNQRNNNISKILLNKINKDNILEIIPLFFTKTFDIGGYHCPIWWKLYVNYYNDREDIISLLKYANIDFPIDLNKIILPHEWNEEALDEFFNNIDKTYVCNKDICENDLDCWTYEIANSSYSFSNNYEKLPWQLLFKNPLLNSEKYAFKIIEIINANNQGYGIYFNQIYKYQKLDKNISKILANNIKVIHSYFSYNYYNPYSGILLRNIKYINSDNKSILDLVYEHLIKISNSCSIDDYIIQMPKEYHLKYIKTLDFEKAHWFIDHINISQEDKKDMLINYIKERGF